MTEQTMNRLKTRICIHSAQTSRMFGIHGAGESTLAPALTIDEGETGLTAGPEVPGGSWKKEIASFFDRLAPQWDARMTIDDRKINAILDVAGVRENVIVLDVACGTGVLFPYFLARNVGHVIGVDISPGMTRIAAQKRHDPRIEVICGDIESIPVQRLCDCCVIYNAFPHFENPQRLFARLARWLKPDGRLTVAHGMSLEALRNHHAGRAQHVSREMLSADEMAGMMAPWFTVDTKISDNEKYVVSGIRNMTNR